MRASLTLMVLIAGLLWSSPSSADRTARSASTETPIPVVHGPGRVLTSGGTGLTPRETAGPDTFTIYGGPDHPTEGKFQMLDPAIPDWGGGNGLPGGYGGGPNAWTPVDDTFQPTYWQQSGFNAANLNNNGPGNQAMWCGLDAADPRTQGWASPPGYGNGWDQILLYESPPVADPALGQVVALDFWFNHDSERGYDFFSVEYDSAGWWTQVLSIDGTNGVAGNFAAPGVRFSDVANKQIEFDGFDYGGDAQDQIRIRIRFRSDGAFSDADGFLDTSGGAVQMDDISLTTSLGFFNEDFEGPGPYLFEPASAPFAGDFAGVYSLLTQNDPCRNNPTGVAAFIDTGQIVRNGPGANGQVSTGGSTSPGSDYGVPGSFVVNYTGGLSDNDESVTNTIISPDILWDVPGSADDDVEIVGARLSFDVWKDLPLGNGIFYLWHVRSAQPGEDYDSWLSRNFVYYGGANGYDGAPGWFRHTQVVSDIIQYMPERVQVRLSCWDYAEVFGFPGNQATPSPWFDNVRFDKYRIAGPAFATRDIDLAQDSFPVSGSIDVSTQTARDALDIPFSMARDINTGDVLNTAGDSVIVDVEARISGQQPDRHPDGVGADNQPSL